jgi:hypothetical protein
MQQITSAFLRLNQNDFLKGLFMAIGGAVFALVAKSIEVEKFTFDFTSIWHTALAAAVVYLTKNLFTPAQLVMPAPPTR